MPTKVEIEMTTGALARSLYPAERIAALNRGVYEGTDIPIRKLTGREKVTVSGTTAGARVVAESWITDRFGGLGARQVKKLLKVKRARSMHYRAARGYSMRRRSST